MSGKGRHAGKGGGWGVGLGTVVLVSTVVSMTVCNFMFWIRGVNSAGPSLGNEAGARDEPGRLYSTTLRAPRVPEIQLGEVALQQSPMAAALTPPAAAPAPAVPAPVAPTAAAAARPAPATLGGWFDTGIRQNTPPAGAPVAGGNGPDATTDQGACDELKRLGQQVMNGHMADSDMMKNVAPIFKKFAEASDEITEMGVRASVSSSLLLSTIPKKMRSFDLPTLASWNFDIIKKNQDLAARCGIDGMYVGQSVLDVTIDPTDLLFLDTLHTYEQVRDELKFHAKQTRKYIVFHDTMIYGYSDEAESDSTTKGVVPAMKEFLDAHPDEWEIECFVTKQPGLGVLKRKGVTVPDYDKSQTIKTFPPQ